MDEIIKEEKPKKVLTKAQMVEKSIITTYRKGIWRPFVEAIQEYELIKDGDKIAVCISGGKDSMLLAKCMQELHRHGRNNFELKFLVMDPGYNDINRKVIVANAELLNVPITIFDTNIFDYVASLNQGSPCYMCARMRRGNLYAFARSLGCNKIALGHHFDDAIETTLMSMLYNGKFKTMMPRIKSKNFEGMELIRPLFKVKENEIINWKNHNELSFINCACRLTEGCTINPNDVNGSKRKEMKNLVKTLKIINPMFDENIFTSLYKVNLNTILSYEENGEEVSFLRNFENSVGEE